MYGTLHISHVPLFRNRDLSGLGIQLCSMSHATSILVLRGSFDILPASMNNLNQQIALVERISFVHNHALDVA